MKGGYRYGQRTRRSLKSRRLTASGVKRSRHRRRRNSYRRKSRRHNRKSKRRQTGGGGLGYSEFNNAYQSEISSRMAAGAYPNTDMGYNTVLDKPPLEYYVATKQCGGI
jgi:hypothetical protein